jgi:hypothetical protein
MKRSLVHLLLALSLAIGLGGLRVSAAVTNADGNALTPPGHPGAVLDTGTNLLWLDATETVNRSLADVQSQLGAGGEFEGFRLATRDEIRTLFQDAGLTLTDGFVNDTTLQGKIQAFVAIYGQTDTGASLPGTNLWHANTFDAPGSYGGESAIWIPTDDRAWVGDDGTTLAFAGTADPGWGVALVREAPEPGTMVAGAAAVLTLLALRRRR